MKHLVADTGKVEPAQRILEQAGFECHAHLFLLARGVVMAAWHSERGDGFLIKPSELGHIIHYGVDYLDPDFQDTPRWKRDNLTATTRMHRYAESVMARAVAEVANASPGVRNQTLNRCAFVLGQYLNWEAFTYGEADEALLNAALGIGLSEREVRSTIRTGLKAGERKPREKSKLEPGQHKPRVRTSQLAERWRRK